MNEVGRFVEERIEPLTIEPGSAIGRLVVVSDDDTRLEDFKERPPAGTAGPTGKGEVGPAVPAGEEGYPLPTDS